MLIKALILISSIGFAQSQADKRVNEHMQKTQKKIEIEGLQKEVELKKDAPNNLYPETSKKPKSQFIVHPPKEAQDPAVLKDQYDHSAGSDPSTEFEGDIIKERNATPADEANREYIRQFKENAAKAGVKVEVDPKTLKARPVKNDGVN